ncbi:MAG: fumarylacetoacetate hydrolase family protein [Thermoplasmata archaeon]
MKIARILDKYYCIMQDKAFEIKSFSIQDLLNREKLILIEKYCNENKDLGINLPQMLDPPVYPSKLLAVGLNYADHARETGQKIPEAPVFFQKATTSVIGHMHPIIYPRIVKELDYEAELAVVIGRRGKYIEKEDAINYVAGFTIMNDVSARDHQFKYERQWFLGKSFDTFAPLGPWIVDKFSIGDHNKLSIKTEVNGEIRQNSNTSNLIFKVEDLINFVSQAMTLEPGDIISTGTPGGVGFVRKPPTLLKVGDVVSIEIENIGILKNTVIEEKIAK